MSKLKPSLKASELTGRNIYHIKNQTIYYDFLSKKGYIITNDMVSKYTLSELIIPASLLIFCLVGIAINNYFISFAIGFVVFVLCELYFRLVFLKKLPEVTKFEKTPREAITIRFAKEMSKLRLVVIILLSFMLTAVLILNNLLMDYSPLYLVLNYILAAFAFAFNIITIIALIIKIKNKY